MFNPIHQHLLLRGYTKHPITDPEMGKDMLRAMVKSVGMVAVTEPQCVYVDVPGNKGLTGSINLATSHIAFHVWDETGLLMADVYSCCLFNTNNPIDVIEKYMGYLMDLEIKVLDRMS